MNVIVNIQINATQKDHPRAEGAYADSSSFTDLLASSTPQKKLSEVALTINSLLFDALPDDEKVAILLEAIQLTVKSGMTENEALKSRSLLISAAMQIGI